MIDIFSYNKYLKLAWVKKYLDSANMGKWKLFFEEELEKYGGKLLFSGIEVVTSIKRILWI